MASNGQVAHTRKKILVVDDDPDVRLLVTLMLDGAGYDVETAEDGYDAMIRLEDTQPDLLLLDLMMPDMDGWEVIDAVRANPETRHLPVVVMSAKIGLITTCDHRVQGYLPKPIVPLAMFETLNEALRQATSSTHQ